MCHDAFSLAQPLGRGAVLIYACRGADGHCGGAICLHHGTHAGTHRRINARWMAVPGRWDEPTGVWARWDGLPAGRPAGGGG